MRLIKENISSPLGQAVLKGYLLDNYDSVDPDRKRPAIIICPGGGFNHLSPREGEPVAVRMLSHGFQAFILEYSLDPARFPVAVSELAVAVAYLRQHAHKFHIASDAIWVAGMSAGGHVAASLGVYWHNPLLTDLGLSSTQIQPNGLLLGYPVITSGQYAHHGSIASLLGDDLKNPQALKSVSLEKQVSQFTPPAFIWSTADDQSVPCENALLFANAMKAHHRPFQLHIFPNGRHGSSLGNAETALPNGKYQAASIVNWPEMFANWAQNIGITFLTSHK